MKECIDWAKTAVAAEDVGAVAVALFEARGDKYDDAARALEQIREALGNYDHSAARLASAVESIAEKSDRIADAFESLASAVESIAEKAESASNP